MGGVIFLRQSTAGQEVMSEAIRDITDASFETGLTIANTDIQIWKCGASTFVDKNSGGATHVANGEYVMTLDATDTNTAGSGHISIIIADTFTQSIYFTVLSAVSYDAWIAGSDYFNVDLNADQSGATIGTVNAVHTDVVADIADGVCDEALSTHTDAGSLSAEVTRIRKFVRNKRTNVGTTRTIYEDDNTTPFETGTYDDADDPTSVTPT